MADTGLLEAPSSIMSATAPLARADLASVYREVHRQQTGASKPGDLRTVAGEQRLRKTGARPTGPGGAQLLPRRDVELAIRAAEMVLLTYCPASVPVAADCEHYGAQLEGM